jgi:hypothetical protein
MEQTGNNQTAGTADSSAVDGRLSACQTVVGICLFWLTTLTNISGSASTIRKTFVSRIVEKAFSPRFCRFRPGFRPFYTCQWFYATIRE